MKHRKYGSLLNIEDSRSLRYSRLSLILHCSMVCFTIILLVFAFPFQIITNGSALTLWVFYVHVCLFIASQFVLFKILRKNVSYKVYSILQGYSIVSSLVTIFCFWFMLNIVRRSTNEYFIDITNSIHVDVTTRITAISALTFLCSLFSSAFAISSLINYKYSYLEHKKFKHWLTHGTIRNNLLLMNNNDKHIFEHFNT